MNNKNVVQVESMKKQAISKKKPQSLKSCIAIGFLCLGVLMMVYGILRGEMAVVYQKAIQICLECIGIG